MDTRSWWLRCFQCRKYIYIFHEPSFCINITRYNRKSAAYSQVRPVQNLFSSKCRCSLYSGALRWATYLLCTLKGMSTNRGIYKEAHQVLSTGFFWLHFCLIKKKLHDVHLRLCLPIKVHEYQDNVLLNSKCRLPFKHKCARTSDYFCYRYSQKRLVFFSIILFHLQQPAVPSLPQEGGCIWVFPAVRAHVEFNVLCTDGATELCGRRWDMSSYTQLFVRIHSPSFHSITRGVWIPFCVAEVSAALL